MNYDVIGDIHGEAGKLRALLRMLGFREQGGTWRHSDRTAIFVGDFIDRGPHQIETLNIVRRMVDGGHALAVLGNHEFNAIAWSLPDPEKADDFLRTRKDATGHKNREQHLAFLTELEDKPQLYEEFINWFLSLPLWLDLPGLRVIHACWHESYMAQLDPLLRRGRLLDRDLMIAASRRHLPEFRAVEALLKGIEVDLPEGHFIVDKGRHERRQARVRWWDKSAVTFRQSAMVYHPGDREKLPDSLIPSELLVGYAGDKPVFFGHYWLTGTPTILSPKAACVDYSAGRHGEPLVAYRWEGESELNSSRFFSAI